MKLASIIPYVLISLTAVGYFVHFGGKTNHTTFDLCLGFLAVTYAVSHQKPR